MGIFWLKITFFGLKITSRVWAGQNVSIFNENSKIEKKRILKNFWKFFFQDFQYLVKKPLTWGCLYNLWEVPIARIWKYICGKVIFGVPEMPPLLGVLGAWMTFKKAEMAKTLRNGLSMIETNPLNHIWSDLVILLGLSLNRFQKKLLLRAF